jgi:hypothetical protein
MQTPLLSGLGLLALLGSTAIAQPRHHETARREGGRSTGTITHAQAGARETGHRVYWQNERTNRHPIVYDHRGPDVIRGDRYVHDWHRGYRAAHDWGHFYPYGGWGAMWGINSYAVVSGVTCEAADEQTGELYPVTANSVTGWSDAAVNSVLGQALDECAAYAGPDACVPAQPACSYH